MCLFWCLLVPLEYTCKIFWFPCVYYCIHTRIVFAMIFHLAAHKISPSTHTKKDMILPFFAISRHQFAFTCLWFVIAALFDCWSVAMTTVLLLYHTISFCFDLCLMGDAWFFCVFCCLFVHFEYVCNYFIHTNIVFLNTRIKQCMQQTHKTNLTLMLLLFIFRSLIRLLQIKHCLLDLTHMTTRWCSNVLIMLRYSSVSWPGVCAKTTSLQCSVDPVSNNRSTTTHSTSVDNN